MECYFLSFGTIKDLNTARKQLSRKDIEHTFNTKHLFIVYYNSSLFKFNINNHTTNKIVLNENHSKNVITIDPRLKQIPF